ncbi:MAG: energy transducer TonB [Zoogloeaceae bacterium]|jgi:protein TonB|nr:energy transducer TonB [Zoogloeaceae bacterium]
MSYAIQHPGISYVNSYAAQQRDPRKHLLGIAAVVIFHLLLVYALANGLGRKVVEVIKAPLNISIIEEVKPPPPPPPPPPKVVAEVRPRVAAPPPPAYVPQVETIVEAPPPLITTTQAPPEPAPPPAPPQPAVVNVAVACPNHGSVLPVVPRQAEGLSGKVTVEFTVAASGAIQNVHVVQSSNSVFNRAATAAVAQYRCIGQGQDVRVRVPFIFQSE